MSSSSNQTTYVHKVTGEVVKTTQDGTTPATTSTTTVVSTESTVGEQGASDQQAHEDLLIKAKQAEREKQDEELGIQ